MKTRSRGMACVMGRPLGRPQKAYLRVLGLAVLLLSRTVEAQNPRDWLAIDDSSTAIRLLRDESGKPDFSTQNRCLLATLLARRASARREDFRLRLEAKEQFDRAFRDTLDPLCLLEYAALLQKQGIQVDASRVADRALRMVRADSTLASPEFMSEVFYRRAAPVARWVREFDFLVNADPPVSTPDCLDVGYFCESYAHPEDFFLRLERAPPLDGAVGDQRGALRALLDSALSYRPDHGGALRLAWREAVLSRDWLRAMAVSERAHTAAPASVMPVLGMLTAAVFLDQRSLAAALLDSVFPRLGPDELARFEGLALIVEPGLRDRLRGKEEVVYADAVWGLSDPLYLTGANERRVEHYARIHLADVLFTDPDLGLAGRDTDQGRLLIRYGLPHRWFVVRADKRREITPSQLDAVSDVLSCGSVPLSRGSIIRGVAPETCVVPRGVGQSVDGGGRWTFWYYDRAYPPFIFERTLGGRVARHKMETASERLDAALDETLPSIYEPRNPIARVDALFTRFPRPRNPVVIVASRVTWGAVVPRRSHAEFGVFVHDPSSGRLVQTRHWAERTRGPVTAFHREISVEPGSWRFAVEGYVPQTGAAGQHRQTVVIDSTADSPLWLSDLLLGEPADNAETWDRMSLPLIPSPDSTVESAGSVGLYWEVYRRHADEREDGQRYRFTLELRDAEGQGAPVQVLRSLGRLLGVTERTDQTIAWSVHEPRAEVSRHWIAIQAPSRSGLYEIHVSVIDEETGARADARRVLAVP